MQENHYTLTSTGSDKDIKSFYEDLEQEKTQCGGQDPFIITCDSGAKIGDGRERPHGLVIRNMRGEKDPMDWSSETCEERKTPWTGHQKHARRERPHGLVIRNMRGEKDLMDWSSETCGERKTPWTGHQKHARRERPHGLVIRNMRGEKDPMDWSSETCEERKTPWTGHQKHAGRERPHGLVIRNMRGEKPVEWCHKTALLSGKRGFRYICPSLTTPFTGLDLMR